MMVDHFCGPAESAASTHRHCFNVDESWSERLVVLSVNDEVDMLTAPLLSGAIFAALKQSPTGLIVDITEVTFLASVGMAVLLAAHEAATASLVRFAVVAEGPTTSRPIRILGIDAILTLYPTLDRAICALSES
jgi:anti-sigma B factor antagonist